MESARAAEIGDIIKLCSRRPSKSIRIIAAKKTRRRELVFEWQVNFDEGNTK
jgi:hypothetical protein